MGGKRNSFFLPVGKLLGSNAWIVFFVNYIHAVFKMFSWLYWNLTNLTSNVELVSMLKNSQSCLGIIIKTSMCAAKPVTFANSQKKKSVTEGHCSNNRQSNAKPKATNIRRPGAALALCQEHYTHTWSSCQIPLKKGFNRRDGTNTKLWNQWRGFHGIW